MDLIECRVYTASWTRAASKNMQLQVTRQRQQHDWMKGLM